MNRHKQRCPEVSAWGALLMIVIIKTIVRGLFADTVK